MKYIGPARGCVGRVSVTNQTDKKQRFYLAPYYKKCVLLNCVKTLKRNQWAKQQVLNYFSYVGLHKSHNSPSNYKFSRH